MQQREDLVAGRNAVVELLQSQRPVVTVFVQIGLEQALSNIIDQCKEQNIPVKAVTKEKLAGLFPTAPHQGVAAQLAEERYSELEDIFIKAGDQAPFIVICDGITDPQNLGAIIRTAEAAGAHGVIIPKRRSVGLTYVVSRASAGAIEHLPIVRVTNLVSTIIELKKKNIWFYAADMGGTLWTDQEYSGGVGLIVGAEGQGVSRLVKEHCDFVVSLPMLGKIESLNASVASGIIMYEIARQRMQKPKS